jgi:hypothetical protein
MIFLSDLIDNKENFIPKWHEKRKMDIITLSCSKNGKWSISLRTMFTGKFPSEGKKGLFKR